MLKKYFILLIIAALFNSVHNSVSMERERKFKVLHSDNQGFNNRKAKKQKVTQEEESQVFHSFDFLPEEIIADICNTGLMIIIKSNSIFTPLNGIKEYLNALSLVDKKFFGISKALGWNNECLNDNKDPEYKQMVRLWFVPKEVLEKGIESLNSEFESFLSEQGKNCMEAILNSQAKTIENIQKIIAQRLIAGCDPNAKVAFFSTGSRYYGMDTALLNFAIYVKQLHTLVPLILSKKGVNIFLRDKSGRSSFDYCNDNDKIIDMLTEYYDRYKVSECGNESDKRLINCDCFISAIRSRESKVIKFYLKIGFDATEGLICLMNYYSEDTASHFRIDSDYVEEIIRDVKIAKLFIEFNADPYSDYQIHPLITRDWLIFQCELQDLEKEKYELGYANTVKQHLLKMRDDIDHQNNEFNNEMSSDSEIHKLSSHKCFKGWLAVEIMLKSYKAILNKNLI